MPGSVSPPPKQSGAKWPGFLVNRSGLPFDELTWNELWDFAGHMYPEAKAPLREIQLDAQLSDVQMPIPPSITLAKQGQSLEYISKVQSYVKQLTYNHTGTQFFETRPNSSMITLMETAKCMIREALPIKCIEAVVLTIYLTNGVPCLGRFPINFKSELPTRMAGNQKYFYHVVLGLAHGKTCLIITHPDFGHRFGSIGLSRRSTLMDKPVEFSSLFELIKNFDEAYKECGHKLVKVRIGNLVTHDSHSISAIPWKGLTYYPRNEDPEEAKSRIDKFSRELKSSLRIR